MAVHDGYDIRLFRQEPTVGAGAQILLLAVLSTAIGLGPAGWLTGSVFAVATWAVLTLALRRSWTRAFGPANQVTLARATLVGGVTALVADSIGREPPVAFLVTLAAVALVLDAVDGQVARRTGTASPLGARFDMEVDAVLILVLSVHVALSMGAWVLLIGGMRYAFVAAAWVLPWLRGALPPSTARKAVAALQGIALLVAAAGVLPRLPAFAAVFLALALLAWSFGRDIAWLWRVRDRRTAGAVPSARPPLASGRPRSRRTPAPVCGEARPSRGSPRETVLHGPGRGAG
ncbi:CDP-alcohol phosphatidyltransferase family protein [Streptomyces sp. 8N706]|uniref:CDP-alcohol phosphatidyltransferase family protein n=1 Tax=Streptomyces sp. 8N706 TaxID=3457416 RepID=UPI003FCF3C23